MEGFNWSILGWIAGLVFVYIFGLYEGRSQGRKRRMAEEEQEKKENPARKSEAAQVDDPGLLRITNDRGTMRLDLDGQRVQPMSLNAQQRKRLIEMLNVMRPWLEGKSASVPAPTNPPPPRPIPAADSRLNAPSPSADPLPRSTTPTPIPSPTKRQKDEPEVVPTSIVAQINMVLQKRIADTPLASRGVSLTESITGGVNVFVGVQRYEMIDDVPDEEIRSAIRSAIAEWENKYTPG